MLRRTPLHRGTRGLRPVSAKRARLNKIYSALRKKFLEEHPYCQWWLAEHGLKDDDFLVISGRAAPPKSCDIHHKRGRGKYLLDVSTWMAVSRMAHDAIHRDPKTAYERGYLLPR